jgi:hypothetical protein
MFSKACFNTSKDIEIEVHSLFAPLEVQKMEIARHSLGIYTNPFEEFFLSE